MSKHVSRGKVRAMDEVLQRMHAARSEAACVAVARGLAALGETIETNAIRARRILGRVILAPRRATGGR